jgi:hypothetical protein
MINKLTTQEIKAAMTTLFMVFLLHPLSIQRKTPAMAARRAAANATRWRTFHPGHASIANPEFAAPFLDWHTKRPRRQGGARLSHRAAYARLHAQTHAPLPARYSLAPRPS